jgi:hypothetical protein
MEKELLKNQKLLNILRDKLARGNKKSIHLNVLPGRFTTRVNLLDLNFIEPNISSKFIDKLFHMPTLSFILFSLNSLISISLMKRNSKEYQLQLGD